MQRPKIFQIIVISIFVTLLILGFLAFSGKIPLPKGADEVNYGSVTVWGTISMDIMNKLIAEKVSNQKQVSITYVEKKADQINQDFIEALARGAGPDIIILSQDNILKNLDKLSIIPYKMFSERDFKSTFLEGGEIFLDTTGIIAIPFTLDPLVMYWNRDMFTNARVSAPPKIWDDFYNLVPKITSRDDRGTITKSLISFGEYRNVNHAKEIVSLLMMQAGSPIVSKQGDVLIPQLIFRGNLNKENPTENALRFFTEFAKTDKAAYSWNRSLPFSRMMFESGDLAIYIGYASEYQSIQKKNPHLNFDVTVVPQLEQTPTKITFGKMESLALVKSSKNPQGSLFATLFLSSKDTVSYLSSVMNLPPIRRDLISSTPTNAVQTVFYDSAFIVRAWRDPSPRETDTMFMKMIESITSGRSTITEALQVAQEVIERLIINN